MIGMATAATRLCRITRFKPSFSLFDKALAVPCSRHWSSENHHNPVATQMTNYAISLARSQKSDESYAQGLLVLEQCQSTQSDDYSKGMVLLAMSTLLSERGNFEEAIEKLQNVQDLNLSTLAVRVAAMEALIGLHLELGQDDTSAVLADACLQLLDTITQEIGSGSAEILGARARAVKGLVELVQGNLESAESYLEGAQRDGISGNVALSYGELLHGMRNLSTAKGLYQKVIESLSGTKDFNDSQNLAACNMAREEALIAATCSLGQLEAHSGNFADAEEILTTALKKAEEHFGSHHPKVGVILTCAALMFRHKATVERSSSLLIQEGLYRRAIELLKAPPLETEAIGEDAKVHRRDIIALARGGYAETLCVQQNRKGEGERMKLWAEAAWKNHRLSLSEALELSESSSKVPVIDARLSRTL